MAAGALGEFLAAKRASISPADHGLQPLGTRRRVPGMRRDEVAVIAKISVDYLARLEQGRERTPSAAVLAGLVEALRLSSDEAAHLHRLAGVASDPLPPSLDAETVRRQLGPIMDTWPRTVAFVIDPALNIHLMNPLAEALFAGFRSRGNLLHMVMLDPAGRKLYRAWEEACESCVAALRATEHFAEPGALEAVLDAMAGDAFFADLWSRHTVRGKTMQHKTLLTAAGEISVDFSTMQVSGAPGWELVIYQPEPGSVDEERLLSLLPRRDAVDSAADAGRPVGVSSATAAESTSV